MNDARCIRAAAAALLTLLPALAQSGPPKSRWAAGPVKFNGFADVYYNANFSHPASRFHPLFNFDSRVNRLDLSMLKSGVWMDPKPFGFTVDVGFGRAFDLYNFNQDDPGFLKYFFQMYGSARPFKTYAMQVDFGKFSTSAGAEVTETHMNWNYSRSLLFANGPYYHFGGRVTLPAGEHFNAGVQVVNGWNNVLDNNSGKTLGLTSAVIYPKFSWLNNYYVGPEKTGTTEGLRNFYDTVVTFTPGARVSAYVNFDYGTDKNIGPGSSDWIGVAGAARVSLGKGFAISPRLEHFYDKDGLLTGASQRIQEFTITGEYKTRWGVTGRLEYRRDWSSAPIYEGKLNHNAVAVGLMFLVGHRR